MTSAQRRRWRTLVTVVLACAIGRTAAAQSYQVVDLGALPGQFESHAVDINNRFQIVGYSREGHLSEGDLFLWEASTGMRPLGIRVSTFDKDLTINDAGVIVGMRVVGDRREPFAWINGVTYQIPNPPGDEVGGLYGLTNNNILLVRGRLKSWAYFAGVYFDLDLLFSARITTINDSGMAGGTRGPSNYLRYPDGREIVPEGPVEILGPAGHFAAAPSARVFQGAGSAYFVWYGWPDGRARIVLSGFAKIDLPRLSRINRSGDLVGTYEFGSFIIRNGLVAELDLDVATGINDAGYIVGSSLVNLQVPFRATMLVPAGAAVPAVPAAPSGLTSSVNGRVVLLQWAVSAGATDYVVEAGSAPGLRDLYVGAVGNLTSFTSPAPPGRYYVRLRAVNMFGVSGPSEEVVIDVR